MRRSTEAGAPEVIIGTAQRFGDPVCGLEEIGPAARGCCADRRAARSGAASRQPRPGCSTSRRRGCAPTGRARLTAIGYVAVSAGIAFSSSYIVDEGLFLGKSV